MEMHSVRCNCCSENNSCVVYEVHRYEMIFQINRCRHCGLMYVNPRPTPTALATYYATTYNYDGFLKARESIVQRCRSDLALIRSYKPTGTLLEVGCMYGFLLKCAAEAGYQTKGVEISHKAASYGKEQLGMDIFCGTVEEANLSPASVDVVFMSHLIEHLEDPLAALTKISHALKPDGVLIMKLPNAGSLMARLTRRHWWWLCPPEHLYHFTPGTIRRMFAHAGLGDVRIKTMHGDLNYLRYLSLFAVEALPFSPETKSRYRAVIDANPKHRAQKILMWVYRLLGPLVWLLHRCNLGEEMLVIASQSMYCTVCGGLLRESLTKQGIVNDYTYYTCQICGTIQLTKDIDEELDIVTENDNPDNRNTKAAMNTRLSMVANYIPEQGVIIDFGCGTRRFTEHLKESLKSKHVNVFGIDEDSDLDLDDFSRDSVAAIFMVEVLEHLNKPNDILRDMSKILKQGGVVYIETTFADNITDPKKHSYVDPKIGHRVINSHTGLILMAERYGFNAEKSNNNVFLLIKR